MQLGLLEIFVSIVFVLNTAVSVFLARRIDLDKTQKVSQIVIVWLIPVVAAIGLWLLNRSHDVKVGAEPKAFGGGTSDDGSIATGEGRGGLGGGD